MSLRNKKTILERLDAGEVIIGDGGYIVTLEKRCYVKAGNWTPESAIEHPQAVEQLAIEYARAGADITQTFTYYSKDVGLPDNCHLTCDEINQAACDIAKKVSEEKKTFVAGGVIHTAAFKKSRDKADVQKELEEALAVIVKNDPDLILVEYFEFILEMEWAIEHALTYGKPVAATMCIGPTGDHEGVAAGECAVRMAKAGAHIIGVNCNFDPSTHLETISLMKTALDEVGLKPYLMVQPNGFKVPDAGIFGWINIPEFPYATEPRHVTRFEVASWAREAYSLGVRVIGGCCGFEPYHIRAMAEELAEERGGLPEGSDKSDHDLSSHRRKAELGRPEFANKGSKDFWMNMQPCTGRPLSTALYKQPNPQLVRKSVLK